MNNRRELLSGIFAALVSIIIIGGSFVVATTEVRPSVAMNITITPTSTGFPTQIILVTQRPGEPTYTPSPTITTPSSTPTSAAVACSPPPDWSEIILQPGDTLDSLSKTYNTSTKTLKESNCLVGNSLIAGTIFYVPGVPLPTDPPCGPPPGWVYYIVQEGDTLFRISRAYGVSVAQLQAANCLGSSSTIRVGQKLYVPNVTPKLPSSTPMMTATSTPMPSATPTTSKPSASPTPVPTKITTAAPTNSPTATDTSTPTPEPATSIPTNTATSTATSTFTPTPTSTFTSTFTPTSTSTATLTSTETFTPVP